MQPRKQLAYRLREHVVQSGVHHRQLVDATGHSSPSIALTLEGLTLPSTELLRAIVDSLALSREQAANLFLLRRSAIFTSQRLGD